MDARRCFFSARIMASEELQAISVTDVYDQAAGIAHEFDKLIHAYGNDCVTELMPKVIRSLEQLENLTSRYEKDVEEINQLRYKVEKLENEKSEKAQERVKFEQELEVIEENWQSEVKDLLSVVTRLQDENKRLRDDIKSEQHAAVAEIKAQQQETEEQEIKVLTKLKETVDKQRQEIRQLKREHNQKGVDCEALSAQLERIAKVNADLRRKNNTQKKQAKTLLEEKAELELMLHTKDEEVDRIRDKITEQEKYDEQRAAVKEVLRASRSVSEEENRNVDDYTQGAETDAEPIHQQLARVSIAEQGEGDAAETESGHQGADLAKSPESPGFDLEGKLIIDLKDPNRPRFTLEELRQVLLERNELKTKLIEVEEELAHYKPREDPNASLNSGLEEDERSSYQGEEILVYGPINQEPEEKVTGKKDSGIRKLFLRILEAGVDTIENLGVEQIKTDISELQVYKSPVTSKAACHKPKGTKETVF